MIRPTQYVYLLGFTLLPHILEMTAWVWWLSAFIVAWAIVADHRPQFKPRKLVLNFITLLFPALVFWEFKTLLGPDAATSLLLLMITLKLFEVYSHRDAIIILALTLMLAMYHLVFRQDLFTTIYMILVMAWAFYLLLKLHRPPQAPKSQKLELKGLIGVETLVSIPLLLTLFFFFPRFSSPIGRFIEKKDSVTGFSEDLRPGDLANLAQSDEVAFRVEFKAGRPLTKDELYFRGQTMEVTNGINWIKAPGREEINVPGYSKEQSGQHYRITFEPRFQKLVFAIDQTAGFQLHNVGSRVSYFDNSIIQTEKPNQLRFQLEGYRTDAKHPYEENSIDQLRLPNRIFEINPRTKELVDSIKARNLSTADTMQALQNYFRTSELTYSLNTPQYDNLDQLLFDDQVGFCEHFASAATILARALGIKSRVVIGFQGGEMNEYGNYLVIRDRHAHAWMEFVNDNSEWERLDPTAAVSSYRIAQGLTLNDIQERESGNATLTAIAKDLWNFVDNLNNQFALALLEMNRDSQLDWLRRLGFKSPNRRTIVLVFTAVISIVLSFILLFLWLRRPKVDPVQKLRIELISRLSRSGIGYTEDLGPLETVKLLKEKKPEEQDLQRAVRDYMDLRYSAAPSRTAEEIYQRLERS